jgi:hypothetical protein
MNSACPPTGSTSTTDSPVPTANAPAWTKHWPPSAPATPSVPKLDRLARSVPDARAIGDDLAARGIKLSLGGQLYDPTDPMGKMFFNILATFAEFSSRGDVATWAVLGRLAYYLPSGTFLFPTWRGAVAVYSWCCVLGPSCQAVTA